MPPTSFCGLDFGTSNSTVGLLKNGNATLAPLEDGKPTLPSALFYSFEDNHTYFGRKAVSEYTEGASGRLLRALKSVLGTSLMADKTIIKSRSIPFTEILGTFIAHLKSTAEKHAGSPLTHVTVGRPVHFVDDNPEADALAQSQLESAVKAQGFQHISFQFEPIAAALDYEQHVTHERLALIIDIGGGTADFSIVRVSPERAKAPDRKQDILANCGVHVGGTDFDHLLSMAEVMPAFGHRTLTKDGRLSLPQTYYFDLSTWHRINHLYDKSVLFALKQLQYEAAEPERLTHLIALLNNKYGHALAALVEDSKIHLTHAPEHTLGLTPLQLPITLPLTRAKLAQAIAPGTERILATIAHTLHQAGVTPAHIQALFLTGGSTQIPHLKSAITALFPQAEVVQGDMFGSVGLGLALDAARKFA